MENEFERPNMLSQYKIKPEKARMNSLMKTDHLGGLATA